MLALPRHKNVEQFHFEFCEDAVEGHPWEQSDERHLKRNLKERIKIEKNSILIDKEKNTSDK